MSQTHNHEDTLRIHDVAVLNWLRNLHVDYGNVAGTLRNDFPILVVGATPDRPFATIPTLLVSLGWIPGNTPEEMLDNATKLCDVLPLPIITYRRTDSLPDPELAGVPKVFATKFFNRQTLQWEQHPWPGHYRTDYIFTVWSKEKRTDVFIREWLMSQLGLPGANPNEMFLPVMHREPWGQRNQSFKLVGPPTDLSDLEGPNPRYIRTEFTMNLRTWLMRKPLVEEGYPINSVSIEYVLQSPRINADNTVSLDIITPVESFNLFLFYCSNLQIPSYWPKTGTAEVQAGVRSPTGDLTRALQVTVKAPGDSVELIERVVPLDGQGLALISMSFAYCSDQPTALEVSQRDPVTGVLTSAMYYLLPARDAWTKVHLFTAVDKPIVNVAIVSDTVVDAVVNLSDIDIRHVTSQPILSADDIVDGGTVWHYDWTNRPPDPVLVLVRPASTTGPEVLTVANDIVSPDSVKTQVLDSAIDVAAVILTQPKANTLRVSVPKTVALASLTLQRYVAAYNGHEL